MNVSELNVCFAMLARDCEKALLRNIPKIQELRSYFKNSYVVVVENDSIDQTKQLLRKWSIESENVHLLSFDFQIDTILNSEGSGRFTSLHRIEKMAFYRNLYMDFIAEKKMSLDLLVVVDLDIFDFSILGFLQAIKNAPIDFGGVFANGVVQFSHWKLIRRYYDTFAYLGINADKIVKNQFVLFDDSKKIAIKLLYTDWHVVSSAFGGVGIYKYDIVKNQRYTALYASEGEFQAVCEHIPFNCSIVKQGLRNYVYRDLYVVREKQGCRMLIGLLLPTRLFLFIRKFLVE